MELALEKIGQHNSMMCNMIEGTALSSTEREKRHRQHLQVAGRTGALAAHFCT